MNSILYNFRDKVSRITLNRPAQLNAFTQEMHLALRAALERAATEARCVLLTGSGRAFCAGQDLSQRRTSDTGEKPDLGNSIEHFYKPLILQLRRMPIPVVCAVNGVAAGAGASLALACDMVLAARSASFIQSFSRVGLLPDSGGTFFLPRAVGLPRAMGLALTGDKLSAEQAMQWGLIWKCIDDADLEAEAQATAKALADGPTLAIVRTRQAMLASSGNDLEQQLNLERDFIVELGKTDDYMEGVASFKEKRPASFTGR